MQMNIGGWMIILLLALIPLAGGVSPDEWRETAPGHFSTLSKEQVDGVMDPLIRNGTYAGAVVVLVDRNGSAVYSYGVSDRTLRTKPDENTLFNIGSVSKTFTGLLLAGELINGEVDLQAPVREYMPEGVTIPAYQEREITLEDLATHTSGLPGVPDSFFTFIHENQSAADQLEHLYDPYETMTAGEAYAFVSNYTLTRKPGTEWEYSNLGAAITGEIVSRRAGSSYEDLLNERILQPLGMNRTMIRIADDDQKHVATGYRGYATPMDEARTLQFNDFWASSGGIYSTGEDMATYLAAQLGIIDTPLTTAVHLSHQPRAVRSEGPPENRQGLFWDIIRGKDEVRVYLKAGETNGFQADIGMIPDEQKGVVILANTAHNSDIHVESEVVQLLREMRGGILE